MSHKSLHSDFIGAIPMSDRDIDQAIGAGLISLDANVLLSFYRYSPSARSALLDVLRAAGDRVFVSHQAAREFWRNRCAAIDGRSQSTKQSLDLLDRSEKSSRDAIHTWAKQTGVADEVRSEVLAMLEDGFARAVDRIEAEVNYEDVIDYDATVDVVYNELSDLLADHVGGPLPDDEQAQAIAEGSRRAQAGIPPGFKDVAKEAAGPDGASGDYLVWCQSVREAKDRDVGLVLVTADEKDDWWWRHRGRPLGPRPELVEEFARDSSHRLIFLRPAQLLEHATALNVAVAEGAAQDVARASDADGVSGWTREALDELLQRLDRDGYVQAEVIREAAAGEGWISRERIYELGGYKDDRVLRGFTRPTARITSYLQEEGWLDPDVEPALRAVYEGGVLATRFMVPMAFVDLLGHADDARDAQTEP